MSQDKEMPFYKRLWFGVTLIAFFLIIATIIIGYIVVNRYDKERDEITTNTISEILKEESKAHPLLSDILVVNISVEDKQQISDSIKKEVFKYLIDKYTKRSIDISLIEIHPYASFLEKKDNKLITGEQVEELKKHIQFLVNNCDRAVEDSKRNIDTEISKINTWVTIWIGIFGLLGILIPILVSLKSFDTLEKIETKVDKAEEKLNEHKDEIKAIAEIKMHVFNAKTDIASIKDDLSNLNTQANTAMQNANTAITQSELNRRMLIAFDAIGKLNKLEDIVRSGRTDRISLIRSYLSSILNNIKTIEGNHNSSFYHDLLEALKENLYNLALTIIIQKRNKTVSISNFIVFINNKLANQNPLTIGDHNEIITHYETKLSGLNS